MKGETATLKVMRQKGDKSDTGDVVFVRENGEWKMRRRAVIELLAA